ncbi:hypothetical protein KBY78_12625, partial [Synechococcus sp. EJ6-Ellesmere]|nr:hypothetical protein [Synechococcus sp. EJ6-Ellesmere]
GTCAAIVSGDNPQLPRSLPVYRLPTAETSCSAVDLAFSGVPNYCRQFLARPGSWPHCSARPSGVRLTPFPGPCFPLPEAVWAQYDWGIQHCVLPSSNEPIRL